MEKRISELLAGINAEGVDMELSNRVSADRIKEITMNKIHTHKKPARPLTKLSRIALVAAIVAMVLAIGAGACMGFVQYENPDEMFEAFFTGEDFQSGEGIIEYETVEIDGQVYEQLKTKLPAWERMTVDEALLETLAPHMVAVGKSVTWEDYTLTVEACLYDASIQGGLLYYTVENPNGVEGYALQPDGTVWWPGESDWYAIVVHPGHSYIDESQSTDTKLYLCSHFTYVEDWGALTVSIGDGADRLSDKAQVVTIDLFDTEIPCISFANDKVRLGYFGVGIDNEGLGLESEKTDIDYIAVRFIDGTEYIVKDEAGFFSNEASALDRGRNGDVTYLFNSLIDLEKVSELVIGDMVFTVK